MNKVVLMGRLTRDVEIKTSASGTSVARTGIAINRKMKKDEVDFINLVAFSKTAEFLGKYFSKGDMLALEGRIQTGSYEKDDGTKMYKTDVIVEQLYFCGGKSKSKDDLNLPVEDELGDDEFPF